MSASLSSALRRASSADRDRDADARARRVRRRRAPGAVAQLGDQAAADVDRVQVAVDVGREDDELVAADAGDGVHRPERRATSCCGDPSQHDVSRGVPLRVVDLLEPVEVDEEDGGAPAASAWRAASAWSMRSTSSARFGRPVSASWVACSVSAAWASCRSAMRSACACAEPGDLAVLRLLRAEVGEREAGELVAVDLERRASRPGPARRRRRRRRGRARRSRRARRGRGSRRGRSAARRRRTSPAATRRSSPAARQQLGQPAVGVQDEPARRERRRPVAHVLDEDPVRPVGGRQREHAPAGSAVGDDEGVDLARADRSQRVLGLGHPDQRLVEGRQRRDRRSTASTAPTPSADRRLSRRGSSPSLAALSVLAGRAEQVRAPAAPCRSVTGRRRASAPAAAGLDQRRRREHPTARAAPPGPRAHRRPRAGSGRPGGRRTDRVALAIARAERSEAPLTKSVSS